MDEKNSLIKSAISIFIPEDNKFNTKFILIYSNRFKGYNGNISFNFSKNEIIIKISSGFKTVSDEIKKGLIRVLFRKIVKNSKIFNEINLFILKNYKKLTTQEELYYSFVKNIGEYTTNNRLEDPILVKAFNEINDAYFNSILNKPRLKWGSKLSYKTFGSYDYSTDTLKINPNIKDDLEVLNFIMYHELLHKKIKFIHGNKNTAHTKEFKKLEKNYPNYHNIEKKINSYSRKIRNKEKIIPQIISKEKKQVTLFDLFRNKKN